MEIKKKLPTTLPPLPAKKGANNKKMPFKEIKKKFSITLPLLPSLPRRRSLWIKGVKENDVEIAEIKNKLHFDVTIRKKFSITLLCHSNFWICSRRRRSHISIDYFEVVRPWISRTLRCTSTLNWEHHWIWSSHRARMQSPTTSMTTSWWMRMQSPTISPTSCAAPWSGHTIDSSWSLILDSLGPSFFTSSIHWQEKKKIDQFIPTYLLCWCFFYCRAWLVFLIALHDDCRIC